MSETYMQFTEESNALDYFERAATFIREASTDSRTWKWAVIALHGALYGFAICACKGTDYKNVTTKTKKGARLLIKFAEALKRCQDPQWMKMTVSSRPLILTNDQRAAIDCLQKKFRNPFEHYIPTDWYIGLDEMPDIAIHCIEVIRFLALSTGNCTMLEEGQLELIESLTTETIAFLRTTHLHLESAGP